MFIAGLILLLIFLFVYHVTWLLILAIIALALGLFGNGFVGSRPPASGRRRYWW